MTLGIGKGFLPLIVTGETEAPRGWGGDTPEDQVIESPASSPLFL